MAIPESSKAPIVADEAFVPRRGLRNGHLQTIAAYLMPRANHLPPPQRRLFSVAEGVQVGCDCHWQPQPTQSPTLMIVHGLEGSSESQYVIGTGNKAWGVGMNVVRMNVRNCGGTERLSATLYHSGQSGDVGAVVRALITGDGLPRMVVAGFSMGGNMVLKLAGEWGADAPPEVRGVAAVCPGMELFRCAELLHRGINRIYELQFLQSLWRSMRRKARLFPQVFQRPPLAALRSIREFDDTVTARYCGFASVDDYYTRASASLLVKRIAVPTLVIQALDDPFIELLPGTRAALQANPMIRLLEPEHGGHCAFLAEPRGYDGRWAERQIVEFFRQLVQ